jgi:hypothetical protein
MALKRRVGRSETETHHTVTLENGGFPLRSYPPYITTLLKENFTFTTSEIAQNFVKPSYGYALSAISSGLAAPENQRGFWKSLFQANVESEFSQQFESDYLLPFSQQEGFSDENFSAFRQTVAHKKWQR